ncbi:MAG: hypothetical protein ACREAB_16220 [Blastocatellia bacterium]
MKQILLFAVSLCCSLTLLSAQAQEREKQKSPPVEAQSSQQQPGPGQLLVTSSPSGLWVKLENEKDPPKTNLQRFGIVEAKSVGKTPLILDLSPGDYTVAILVSFNRGDAMVAKVPRDCSYGLSFSGSSVQWFCWKCNFYPTGDKQIRDPIDPYKRDGNIGFCFYASDKADSPNVYYRVYAIQKGNEAARLEAKFEEDGKSKK